MDVRKITIQDKAVLLMLLDYYCPAIITEALNVPTLILKSLLLDWKDKSKKQRKAWAKETLTNSNRLRLHKYKYVINKSINDYNVKQPSIYINSLEDYCGIN